MQNKMYRHFYCIIAVLTASLQGFAQGSDLPLLPPMPEVPASKAVNSVPLGDATSFQEVLLDLPIADGPFKPNWESIERNYPGTPQWLRDAKIGFWVHFGPQAAFTLIRCKPKNCSSIPRRCNAMGRPGGVPCFFAKRCFCFSFDKDEVSFFCYAIFHSVKRRVSLEKLTPILYIVRPSPSKGLAYCFSSICCRATSALWSIFSSRI